MYPILIRSLVTIALAVLCAANISNRCTGMELFKFDPSALFANCQNDKGEINPSFIDLNTCIGFDETERTLRCGYLFHLVLFGFEKIVLAY
jgi:hypothetical protein